MLAYDERQIVITCRWAIDFLDRIPTNNQPDNGRILYNVPLYDRETNKSTKV